MANFDNLFRKQNETTEHVPKIVLEKLNQGLPKGLEYRILDKENLILTPNGSSEITFSGIQFVLPEKYIKLLGNRQHSLDLLEFYSTNTQTSIQIKPANGNQILVNGTSISLEDFIKNPFGPCTIQNGAFYMLPYKFAPPFEISVGDGIVEKMVLVQRVPYDSLDEIKYETVGNECLKVTYYLNTKAKSLRFSFTLNTRHAKSVQDLLDCINIFYAFRRGQGFIFGRKHSCKPFPDADQDTFNLRFWKHVKELENIFNISFSIRNKKITNEISWKLEELYQMLIEKNIIRERKTLSKLFVNVDINDNLEAGLNNQICLEYVELQTEKILGKKLEYLLLKGIFNAKIDQIKDELNGKKVSLVPFNENQIYVSKLAFLKEVDLVNYQNIDRNEYIPAFEKAKTLIEILAEEEKAE